MMKIQVKRLVAAALAEATLGAPYQVVERSTGREQPFTS
jgi:hypothetical protein